ncbi:glycerophosphodiester phosphodiesterase [Hymenobacter sp. GOD-10R]|uniref:glycerophosphodiester phosphodiesterase n=1 Tax=Hymenobacter sp. GOD-10R TaxID=3093922 RepID=UPI002D79E833|nr:glycerophosphodiester phosphodiesterase family protein [Hymenobacter sp. GOD-10R]WRQ31217.1 glycerophosphodiester phosphodiesterase family protein [Hymenobacter sp. GOD-10R]
MLLKNKLLVAGLLATVGLGGHKHLLGDDPGASRQVPARPIMVLGHAGSGFFTPINPFNPLPPSSLAGLQRALARGADGIEIDVRLSRDSVPFVYHDPTLNSMSTGEGCVSQYTAAELEKLAYRGGMIYDLFHDEHLMRLQTVLDQLPSGAQAPAIHVDLHEDEVCAAPRSPSRSPVLARALARLLRTYSIPPDRLLVLSGRPATLRQLRTLLPQVPLGLEITQNFDAGLQRAIREKMQAVVVSKDVITPERSTQAQAAGLQVVVFGGRSAKAVARLVRCHPDAIEVDNVPELLTQLGRPVEQE